MNIDAFWTIIEVGAHSEEPEALLTTELSKLDPVEIASFQQHFDALCDRAYTWKLWGAAYIIEGGCSDDGFIDFRYGLISKGQTVYEAAIESPDSLAQLGSDLDICNEAFGYVAQTVYEEKTGAQIHRATASPKEGSMGEDWDFDDADANLKQLPILTALYACEEDTATCSEKAKSSLLASAASLVGKLKRGKH